MRKLIVAALLAGCAVPSQAGLIEFDLMLSRDKPGTPASPLIAAHCGVITRLTGQLYFDPDNPLYVTFPQGANFSPNSASIFLDGSPITMSSSLFNLQRRTYPDAVPHGSIGLRWAKDVYGINFILSLKKRTTLRRAMNTRFRSIPMAPAFSTAITA